MTFDTQFVPKLPKCHLALRESRAWCAHSELYSEQGLTELGDRDAIDFGAGFDGFLAARHRFRNRLEWPQGIRSALAAPPQASSLWMITAKGAALP